MILDTLAASARTRVERNKAQIPFGQIKKAASRVGPETGFPFEKALLRQDINFICEVKKASPSKGVIAQDFPYLQIAKDYEQAGAAAISVLTEPDYFLGSDEFLFQIQKEVFIPVLRKDFTVDTYQIYEAKTIGASAVLLICALLDTRTIRDYISVCDELGLSALVEAHDEREIESALAAGARIIGVNNRNLKDFTVDINNSVALRKLVPENILFVAESGIQTASDIDVLRQAKVNGVLIGETLMRSPDKGKMLEELRGGVL
ncbi:indole-3-glycerol phosphate synthase TrpC [Desulfosporosinus metallidurans]|uniref:Indole-3-glycerol phosphate synthase n=1 Tax=Desulfosporosinus metallidurans TaxID=1888891 RepID=A0A1Q8QJ03_9FIRM|nr:indole-3-glycerol phosphate synthase TrpC [Desulfosporosinus metallidurans]OLN27327.1 Indole-3-glycerol phosphate synthase [Desulfosporosinus metallidurans]